MATAPLRELLFHLENLLETFHHAVACATKTFFSGSNYCLYCGASVSVDKPSVKFHKVQFSAIAPKVLTKGEYTIIGVVMYEESCRYIVDELISAINEPAQETRSGVQKVNEGAEIKIVLNSPDLAIEDNIETGI